MNAHAYALEMERIFRSVFHCERGGFAGLIDADAIERNCYVSIASALGYLYAKSSTAKQKEIETFIIDYAYYLEFGIDGLLSFNSNERDIEGISYSIDFENGEKALIAVLDALSNVCE